LVVETINFHPVPLGLTLSLSLVGDWHLWEVHSAKIATRYRNISTTYKKMEAVEMWLWRHMLGIKWSDKVRNAVLQLIEGQNSERKKKRLGLFCIS